MLVKTRGIVLGFVKYKESSIIVKIFTEELGLKSYIVNGVRSSKSKQNKIAFFQPLTLLELVVYNKENRDINRISEVRIYRHYQNLAFNQRKISVVIFLTEVLNKLLKEESENHPLFDFLVDSFLTFDSLETNYENFHLQFLIKLAEYFGLAIYSYQVMLAHIPDLDFLDAKDKALVDELIRKNYAQHIPMNRRQRQEIIQWLVKFYQFHFEHFGELNSLAVLREVQ